MLRPKKIKVTKLNIQEENFKKRIESSRNSEEHASLRRELCCFVSYHSIRASPSERWDVCNLSNFSTDVYCLAVVYRPELPYISYTGRLMGKASLALNSLRRIDEVVGRELRPDRSKDSYQTVSNGSEKPLETMISLYWL
jgi:hypothetical protein